MSPRVTLSCLLAFGSPPAGPSQAYSARPGWQRQGNGQQAPPLRDRERGSLEVVGYLGVGGVFFFTALARILAKKACAIIESVICRDQLGEVRTSE